MDFMCCNTCAYTVQVNATGICLGCQKGFCGPQEDAWTYSDYEKQQPLVDYVKEKYAFKQEEDKSCNLSEHKNGNRSGKASETGGSDRLKRRRKV